MLENLKIKNFVLLKDLNLNFNKDISVITGETGAGKTLLIKALNILTGGRFESNSIIDESQKCIIEGIFDISNYKYFKKFQNFDTTNIYKDKIILRRELFNKKSRTFINDTPVKIEVLKTIAFNLVDIHSQFDNMLLKNPDYQLNILDIYAKNHEIKLKYNTVLDKYLQSKHRFDHLKTTIEKQKQTLDYNKFLLKELTAIELNTFDQIKKEKDLQILENAENIKTTFLTSKKNISEGPESILDKIDNLKYLFGDISNYSEEFSNILSRIESIKIEILDILLEIENHDNRVEYNQNELNNIQESLNIVYGLHKKHGTSKIEELIKIKEDIEDKIFSIDNLDNELIIAEKKLAENLTKVLHQANKLSESRKNISQNFTKKIRDLLSKLGIPEANLSVNFTKIGFGNSGIDKVDIMFTANKGLEQKKIQDTASGGEISRLMLCIKYILAGQSNINSIVFDEIDTGVSGEVSNQIAHMINEISKSHQVIVITHLPQVASIGSNHLYIYKNNKESITESKIEKLSKNSRITEIAKMIGGNNPSELSIRKAEEMIERKF